MAKRTLNDDTLTSRTYQLIEDWKQLHPDLDKKEMMELWRLALLHLEKRRPEMWG